ncbi:MAG: AAA family ATPase [Mesorhizobium sp.]
MATVSDIERHFERRLKAARIGLHLPSEEELLRGMAFFGDELRSDIREYAGRLTRCLKKREREELAPLIACLEDLAVEQSEESVKAVAGVLDRTIPVKGIPADGCRLRVQFYLAAFGDPIAAGAIAGEMASLALRDIQHDGGRRMLSRALSWSLLARTLFDMHRDDVFHGSQYAMLRMRSGYQREFEAAIWRPEPADEPRGKTKPSSSDDEYDVGQLVADDAEADRLGGDDRLDGVDGIVVIPSIGNETTSEGKRVCVEYKKYVQRRLPLAPVPDLSLIRKALLSEFSYAASVIDSVLWRMVGCKYVHMRPTILVGPPGCGKTRLARRLCEELADPYELVPCGGMSDSAIGGTARRWSSGEPSIAVMAIRRHDMAGPVVILDEIEKVGTSRHNGNPHDVLIGLFERETSSRWFDPYIESACDLSHVSWLMTANTLAGVPSVLLDRCRIIVFPEPGPDQLGVLAPRILERLYVGAGHDPRWAEPLEDFEMEALRKNWPGGSIRKLERLIEVLIEARERNRPRQ